MANTQVLFNAVSQLNGDRIKVYWSQTSSNSKTGNIPNINFMPDNVKPTDSVKSGDDASVCGNCPLRPINFNPKTHDKPCYLNLGFGQNSIFNADGRGNIPSFNWEAKTILEDIIRIGTWGDSASLEKSLLLQIVKLAKRVVNYTHQWELKKFNFLKAFSMASVHTVADKIKANKLGFRTFRTIKPLPFADHVKHINKGKNYAKDLQADEILCPNFVNDSVKCKQCGLCCGDQIKSRVNIVNPSH